MAPRRGNGLRRVFFGILLLLSIAIASAGQDTKSAAALRGQRSLERNGNNAEPQPDSGIAALHTADLMFNTRRLTSTTQANAQAQANKIGAKVRNAIKQLRGGNTKFYQNLVTAIEAIKNDDSSSAPYADGKATLKKWAQGVLIFIVPGIILAVLSLLTMLFFIICRCCCNRCGGRSPKEGGYTCMQKFWPLLFFLLFAVGVVAVAAAALFLFWPTVLSSVTDTFDATTGTLTNATTWVADIEAPLISIRDTVTSSATSIGNQLSDTSFIGTGITGISDELYTFGNDSAGRTLPTGCTVSPYDAYCLACTVCTTISTEVALTAGQITTNAGPAVTALNKIVTSLTTLLVSIADTVRSSINDQVSNVDSLTSTITSARDKVETYQGKFDNYKKYLQVAVLVLFAFALVTVAIGLIGVLFGLTPLKFLANIIHIAYFIGFIALFLTFILSSVLLATGVIFGDVCEITTIFTEDWTVPFGSNAKALNACFQNESLIEVFNLTSDLEFATGGLNFPTLNLTSVLDFSQLDTFAAAIQATNASTFALNDTGFQDLLDLFNSYTTQSVSTCTVASGTFTTTNILDPWTVNGDTHTNVSQTGKEYILSHYSTFDSDCASGTGKTFECMQSNTANCTYSVFLGEAYRNASNLALVKQDSATFITELHTNMTGVTNYTSEFKSNITELTTNITDIQTSLEASLFKYVGEFEDAMYCTFIADGYYTLYNALCGDLMPAIIMISLMLFLAGVFLIPVNICLIIACKRLKARGNGGHVMDNEMKFK